MFVNAPALERQEKDSSIIAAYWRGHLQRQTVDIFPPDGTVKCKERLKSGTDCRDPKVCATPNVVWVAVHVQPMLNFANISYILDVKLGQNLWQIT